MHNSMCKIHINQVLLNPGFIVERMAAETQPWINVREMWDIRYDQVVQRIAKKMEELDLWQGKFYKHQPEIHKN